MPFEAVAVELGLGLLLLGVSLAELESVLRQLLLVVVARSLEAPRG